jgi:hypothetical protein
MTLKLSESTKNTIELVRKFELGDCELIHPLFHHYRFKLSNKLVNRISIIEIMACKDWLIDNELYVKATKAEIINLSDYR